MNRFVSAPWELFVGWRYLYRGKRSRRVLVGLAASLAVLAAGVAWTYGLGQPSPVGVLVLTAGAIGAVVSSLLCLLTVFTTVSVVGVVLGVASLTVVLSVTSGFQAAFRDKVLGVNAHVLVMKNSQDFHEYRAVEARAKALPGVLAVQPFVFMEMLVTRGKGELSGVAIKGVDPARVGTVLDLPQHMIDGEVSALAVREPGREPPIILGKVLAEKLNAKRGDVVTIVSPLSGRDPAREPTDWRLVGGPPRTRKFQIAGIFYSGFDEYDRRLMYIDIREAQDFLGQGDVVMGVELRLANVEQARATAHALDRQLEQELPRASFVVMDWQKLNENLFAALRAQKVVLLVLLTLIILVAAFNMVAALTMMVFDRTKEIAILKSMGGSSGGVARVFLVVGTVIGGVGTALGLALGLLLCSVVSRYGYALDPRVYLIDRLPIRVNPEEVVLVGAITIVICVLTTLYPVYRASSLRPVDGLRYD
ncbi:MAG: ABC transporter permease [Myxococcales bacterium]|nr:ABC transporter permease [Myxococcales bacterium]